MLLFGIVASGMVRLRKIVGYEDMAQVVTGRQFDHRESHQMALAA